MRTTRSNYQNIDPAYQEKLDEREAWYKIVIKILNWKDGIREGGSMKFSNKVTLKEWNTYCQGMIRINVIRGKDKTMKKLEEMKKVITLHGGFK